MSDIIETERLILRPLRRGDLTALVAALDNLNVSRWTARIPHPYTLQDAEEFFELTRTVQAGTLRLSLVLKAGDGSVCGGIGYEAEAGRASAELGYWLAEPLWGQGLTGEAAGAMTAHAFEVAGHQRLTAGYKLGNDASRRILERLGFAEAGLATIPCRATASEESVMRMELTRECWAAARH